MLSKPVLVCIVVRSVAANRAGYSFDVWTMHYEISMSGSLHGELWSFSSRIFEDILVPRYSLRDVDFHVLCFHSLLLLCPKVQWHKTARFPAGLTLTLWNKAH